ncbi:hypothetical protein [Psychrobacter sp. I-STPA6b]|uniref:hypothetical protein n=1 Tax=Psychrobacter sp. I-STPA6b TaxID=2585718 RepID=UPI001D0C55BA|nr:hypothetical protein [Psychrobacter sp. I-STPA6b]
MTELQMIEHHIKLAEMVLRQLRFMPRYIDEFHKVFYELGELCRIRDELLEA